MNNCIHCNKETPNPKFCSSSCSASHNNKGVRRNGNAPTLHSCKHCGTEFKHKHGTTNTYCSMKCQHGYEYAERIAYWKRTGTISKGPLKRYLAEKQTGCWECGITDWNGKPIVLELEHINGNSNDNSEENVSLLCPNCHSQTDTYKGKNRGNGRHDRRQRYAEGKSY